VWNGGGTVRLVVTDALNGVPSPVLVDAVQQAIDPTQDGHGIGMAPIGHIVTVEGVTATAVDVDVALEYEAGATWAGVQGMAVQAIDLYLGELAAAWDEAGQTVVRVSQIESRLLGVEGIRDVTGTTLNGAAGNLVLGADSIPERGLVNGS
jgi:uncharacterized phage protein gp47/JayE